jgi:carbonic anhydrase
MDRLEALFRRNRAWAESMTAADPDFFRRLSNQQAPRYLWIGCSDSRVPANQIVDLAPGEMFVQRNVANLAVHTDLNLLSVLQFAVDVLRVEHVIVCGHYGCGGVRAAARGTRLGLTDNWLRHVQNVGEKHAAQLEAISDPLAREDRLCELNAIEQVWNVSQTTIVLDAWTRGQPLSLHAWVYGLEDGLLRDLRVTIDRPDAAARTYREALAALAGRS